MQPNQATGYASQHKSVPVPSQDKLEGLRGRKSIRRNIGGLGMGALLVSVGVASAGTVGASASIIFLGEVMGVGAPLVRDSWFLCLYYLPLLHKNPKDFHDGVQ